MNETFLMLFHKAEEESLPFWSAEPPNVHESDL